MLLIFILSTPASACTTGPSYAGTPSPFVMIPVRALAPLALCRVGGPRAGRGTVAVTVIVNGKRTVLLLEVLVRFARHPFLRLSKGNKPSLAETALWSLDEEVLNILTNLLVTHGHNLTDRSQTCKRGCCQTLNLPLTLWRAPTTNLPAPSINSAQQAILHLSLFVPTLCNRGQLICISLQSGVFDAYKASLGHSSHRGTFTTRYWVPQPRLWLLFFLATLGVTVGRAGELTGTSARLL